MNRNGKFFRSSDVTVKNNGWKMEHQNFVSSSCTVLYKVKDGVRGESKENFLWKNKSWRRIKTIEWGQYCSISELVASLV